VCRKAPAGYSIQYASAANPAGSETGVIAVCPGASVPIGGGGFSSNYSTDDLVAMNTSYPVGQKWYVYENNGESQTRSIYSTAICAGT
jgi:hypothetical protein